MAIKYQGIPKYQSPAFRADRALYNALGAEGYAAYRAERESYYRDLLQQARRDAMRRKARAILQ